MAKLHKQDSVFLNIDYEFAKELHSALCKVDEVDDKYNVLSLDDHAAISELRSVLCSKIILSDVKSEVIT